MTVRFALSYALFCSYLINIAMLTMFSNTLGKRFDVTNCHNIDKNFTPEEYEEILNECLLEQENLDYYTNSNNYSIHIL